MRSGGPSTGETHERRAFLLAPGRTGHLATVREDGRTHVAPVWFTLDGNDVLFNTGADTVKGRNLRRTGRAAMLVDLPVHSYGFVHLEGPVRVDDDHESFRGWSRIIAARYVPHDEVDAYAYADRNAVLGELLLRLTPHRGRRQGPCRVGVTDARHERSAASRSN